MSSERPYARRAMGGVRARSQRPRNRRLRLRFAFERQPRTRARRQPLSFRLCGRHAFPAAGNHLLRMDSRRTSGAAKNAANPFAIPLQQGAHDSAAHRGAGNRPVPLHGNAAEGLGLFPFQPGLFQASRGRAAGSARHRRRGRRDPVPSLWFGRVRFLRPAARIGRTLSPLCRRLQERVVVRSQ